ncbi:MAG: hypothetical protein NTZ54_02200 [Alphaproteobacteria bacterium]|nr:hypothetical protein [Alphaproteobacteria bacterium]
MAPAAGSIALPPAGLFNGTRNNIFRLARHALLCGAGLLLACCQAPSASLDSTNQIDLTAKTPKKVTSRGNGPVMQPAAQAARYEVYPGVSTTADDDGGKPPAGVSEKEDGKFTVNVDDMNVSDASKLILGETLGYNYTIDPNLQANITMVSNRALSARQLLDCEAGPRIRIMLPAFHAFADPICCMNPSSRLTTALCGPERDGQPARWVHAADRIGKGVERRQHDPDPWSRLAAPVAG